MRTESVWLCVSMCVFKNKTTECVCDENESAGYECSCHQVRGVEPQQLN